MKRTQKNFLDWAKGGMAVTCRLQGKKVTDARLAKKHASGEWYICQNTHDPGNKFTAYSYKYSWCVGGSSLIWWSGVTNLRPAKQSHKRKPSPDSELVGSCTLLKKWKWLVYGKNTCWLSTHKPEFLGVTVRFPGLDADWVEVSTRLLGRIAGHNYSKDECLYRRQGDSWVHVG